MRATIEPSPGSRSGASTWRAAALVLAVALLAGCASRTRAPVEDRTAAPPPRPAPSVAASGAAPAPGAEGERGPTYTVKRGDTLVAIALDAGVDYRQLAAWNGIENPNVIRVGQVLRLTAPGEAAVANANGVVTTP